MIPTAYSNGVHFRPTYNVVAAWFDHIDCNWRKVTKRIYGAKRQKKTEEVVESDQPNQQNSAPPAVSNNTNEFEAEPLTRSQRRKKQAQQVEEPLPDILVCQLRLWQRAWRWLGFTLISVLTVSFLASDYSSGIGVGNFSWKRELFSFCVLLFFTVTVLLPILFECWYIKADKDQMDMRALFWTGKVRWDDLKEFRNPKFLKFALLRTKSFFYLVNKFALPDFPKLERMIKAYGPSKGK